MMAKLPSVVICMQQDPGSYINSCTFHRKKFVHDSAYSFSGFMPSQYRTTQFLKDPSLYDVRYTGSIAIGQYSKLPDSNISEEELLEMQQRAEEEAKTTQSWWTTHSYLKGLCDMVQWCDGWNICGLRTMRAVFGRHIGNNAISSQASRDITAVMLLLTCIFELCNFSSDFIQN